MMAVKVCYSACKVIFECGPDPVYSIPNVSRIFIMVRLRDLMEDNIVFNFCNDFPYASDKQAINSEFFIQKNGA